MLPGDNVIVVERKFSQRRREMTILAALLRPSAHSLLQGCVHDVQATLPRNDSRALAFRNSKARPTFK